jgi:hypothetical protein
VTRRRKSTIWGAVSLFLSFSIYGIVHYMQERQANDLSVTLCTDQTLPGGAPIPVCNPTTTYSPPGPPATNPPASQSVPTSKGYSSQGWAVVAGSVSPSDSAWDGASMVVRNEQHTAQTGAFDLYIYQSVVLVGSTTPVYTYVCDLEGQTNGPVNPGATASVPMSSTGNLDEPGTIPEATYNYVFVVDPY